MARPIKTGDEALINAVGARPGSTGAEVAAALGVGQSTATKRLAALETAGAVRRTPGGRVNGQRAPDRWQPAEGHATDGHPAGGMGVGGVASAGVPAVEQAGEQEGAAGAPAAAGSARLGRGALAVIVRDYLAARPGEAFSPAALGTALGRSAGAVSNALAAMVERGEAVLVADRPRRYRITR